MKTTNIFAWILLEGIFWLSMLMFTTACQEPGHDQQISSAGEPTNVNATLFFAIHIFDIRNPVIPEGIDFQSENSWRKLLTIDLNQSDLVINEEDIKFYDWSSQKITLENDAGMRFVTEQPQSPGFSYFVIAINGKSVSAGGILSESSAVGANLPILYIPDDPINSDPFNLVLRSTTDITNQNPRFPVDDPAVAEEIRQYFWETNKLIE